MTEKNDQIAVTITPVKVGFLLSVLTLCGMVFTSVSMVMEMRYRISALETTQSALVVSMKDELGRLNETITNLGLAIRELETIQRVQE